MFTVVPCTVHHCPIVVNKLGFPPSSAWRLLQSEHPVHKSTSCGDITCEQCTVTVEPCQSTQGGLVQQAGDN